MAEEIKSTIKGAAGRNQGNAEVVKKNNVLGKLKVEYVGLDDIRPNSYNPNRQSEHDFELLCRSMKEDGFTQPIVVLQSTKEIVDGEHRWRAARAIGMKEVPAVFVDMTPEQMRIATLRHNRARGSEDMELATQVLKDLRELGALDWAQDSLMMDDTELARLLEETTAPEGLANEEFSNAWNPSRATSSTATNEPTRENIAMSAQAADKLREQEKKVAAATTEEERVMAEKDVQVYRLNLVFADDEASLVKKALGDRPAQLILDWCRAAVDAAAGAAAQ